MCKYSLLKTSLKQERGFYFYEYQKYLLTIIHNRTYNEVNSFFKQKNLMEDQML